MTSRGRPKKHFGPRTQIAFRVSPEMRLALGDLARKSGRSVSQEVEFILEKVIFPITLETSLAQVECNA